MLPGRAQSEHANDMVTTQQTHGFAIEKLCMTSAKIVEYIR